MPTQNDTYDTRTLEDADRETRADGGETYTLEHPAGPITLQIAPDHDCMSPVDPGSGDFLPALAMIGRARYAGTADDIPEDMTIPCPPCRGTGVADGDDATDCPACEGFGETATDDVAAYLRASRDAVAVLELDIGQHREQSAVLYFTAEDVDAAGITDPAAALQSHAEEYRQWEDGDCWGYVCEGPASEDSCWGFIGSGYAMTEANAAFRWALHRADVEHAEASYWAARGVETVA